MENNKNIDIMYSSEDSNSSISSNDKHSNHYKQVLPMNNSNSVSYFKYDTYSMLVSIIFMSNLFVCLNSLWVVF